MIDQKKDFNLNLKQFFSRSFDLKNHGVVRSNYI